AGLRVEPGRLGGVAGDLRKPVESLVGPPPDGLRIGPCPLNDGNDDPALLLEQGDEQVLRCDLRVPARAGEPLGGCEGLLGLDCESICLHKNLSLCIADLWAVAHVWSGFQPLRRARDTGTRTA